MKEKEGVTFCPSPDGNQYALASLLASFLVVHLFIQFTIELHRAAGSTVDYIYSQTVETCSVFDYKFITK